MYADLSSTPKGREAVSMHLLNFPTTNVMKKIVYLEAGLATHEHVFYYNQLQNTDREKEKEKKRALPT